MWCYSECTCSGVCGVTVSVPVVGCVVLQWVYLYWGVLCYSECTYSGVCGVTASVPVVGCVVLQ